MANLSDEERRRIWAHLMRLAGVVPGSITKADLRAAVDATDAWIDLNAAGFNTALPLAVRNAMSSAQKTLLFCYVAMRRAGILKALEDA